MLSSEVILDGRGVYGVNGSWSMLYFVQVDQRADGQATLKLYDLGLAADASNTLDSVCGTPTYMAPEMIRGAGYVCVCVCSVAFNPFLPARRIA